MYAYDLQLFKSLICTFVYFKCKCVCVCEREIYWTPLFAMSLKEHKKKVSYYMSDLETLSSMFMDVESTQTIWNKSTLKFAIILVSTYKWLIVDIGNSDLNGPRHQAWCESSKFITTASGGEGGNIGLTEWVT